MFDLWQKGKRKSRN